MDIADLVWLDATELARLIAGGEVTAVEVVQAHRDRIQAVGERVNAFRHGARRASPAGC